MPDYLLDTSVFSQPLRKKPNLTALERWQAAGDKNCAVSEVSLAEVHYGLHYENNPRRWDQFQALLHERLPTCETDAGVWNLFAKMKARQRALGEPVSDLDLLIAATAVKLGRTVATLNARDFSRMENLKWENWGV